MRHIPSWFPGAGFRKIAKAWAVSLADMVDRPYLFVKQQIVRILCTQGFLTNNFRCSQASCTALYSFASDVLEDKRLTLEEEFDLKWAAASLYAGTPSGKHFVTSSDLRVRRCRYCKSHVRQPRQGIPFVPIDSISDILVLPCYDSLPRDHEEGSSRDRCRRWQ